MKLSQVDITVFTELFGKEFVDKLSGALSPDDGELSLGARLNGRVISQEDESALKTTLTDAGIEIGYKKLAKEAGITLDSGEKDAKIIADKIKSTITETLEEKYKNPQPGEREKELEDKLLSEQKKYEKLFKTHETKLKEVEEWQTKYQTKEIEIKNKERNNFILKSFPDKMNQDREDALIITNARFLFDEKDGEDIVIDKKTNQVILNAVGKPESKENVIKSFVEEKKWIKIDGMNGNDRDGVGSKKGGKTPEEAHKYIAEKLGPDKVASPEGISMFRELTKTE